MIVYLAARYSRKEEMRRYAAELAEIGYTVRCDWVTGDHDLAEDREAAEIDLNDVLDSEILISFTEPPAPTPGRARGGRHVEFGIALAAGNRCIVVGHRENIFHYLADVEFYPTWELARDVLRQEASTWIRPMTDEDWIAYRDGRLG